MHAQQNQDTLDGYTLFERLGSGFAAVVKRAADINGNQYAIKIFDKQRPNWDSEIFKLAKAEYEVTSDFEH